MVFWDISMMEFLLDPLILLSLGVYLPFISLIFRRKPLWSQSSTKLFSAYIILDVIAWFLSVILSQLGIHNIIVSNLFAVGEFLLVSLFYIEILEIKRKTIAKTITGFLTIIFGIGVFISSNEAYNSYPRLASGLIFIILSLLFFNKLMREQKIQRILSYPIFYLNTGILLYFSCSIFIVIFSNYFLNLSNEAQIALWSFHSIINFICYVIFAVGFLKCKLRTKY